MGKKPKPESWYAQLVDKYTPRKKVFRNCLTAFAAGGLLCALAQLAEFCLMNYSQLSQKDAVAVVVIVVVFLTALFTGLGIYDKAGQKVGAGLAVPISGFANSVAAAMLEHKSEGYVLGSGCNSFKLAGSVVVFGIASAFTVVFAAWILGWL